MLAPEKTARPLEREASVARLVNTSSTAEWTGVEARQVVSAADGHSGHARGPAMELRQ